MSELLEQVEMAIIQRRLFVPGERLLVAVSGGLDSVSLLHVLNRLRAKHGWQLTIAHFNHRLRGRSSDADERLVRGVGQELGLKVKVAEGDVRSFAKRGGFSLEMAARQLRHRFLVRAAAAVEAAKVVLAHHADDQVELFFLRLFRGAGPEGLAGMRWSSPSPSDDRIQLVRPLLGVTRQQLATFARVARIRFHHDATNDQLICERNQIRQDLLPLLKREFQPALSKTVLRLMEILGSESDLVAQVTREWQRTSIPGFGQLHVGMQRRWLFWECLRLGVTPDFELIETLRSAPNRDWMVRPAEVIWRDEAGQVHLRRTARRGFRPDEQMVDLLQEHGSTVFGKVTLAWQVEPWGGGAGCLPRPSVGCERFDADRIGAQACLRHWRPGDRFRPIGMRAPVKVQNWFTNLKVPRARRSELAVATTSSGEIFWIEGLRIGEEFKINPETRRCLKWEWHCQP